MKTIEQKAKAYDEAIKVAKSKIKNDKDHVLYEDDVIEIFPELAESDDESVRKEIATYLRGVVSNRGYSDKTTESWITWLEKQKHGEVAIEGQVRDHNFIDFDSSGTSFMIPVPNHNLKCGDKVLVKILKLE